MKQLVPLAVSLALLIGALPASAAEPVSLTTVDRGGHRVYQLENYRVRLVIDPARGGAVVSYSDKLAPAELILQKEFDGLCLDHFQEQNWPGEFLEQPYDGRIVQQTAAVVAVCVSRKATGIWQGKLANPKLSDLLLEKTYTLRADSPVLTCAVKLTAPADQSKVFSYWLQDVNFAGGGYDAATDRTFRPSARGIRNTGAENNGHYGKEEWLRDFSAGWMALLDTRKKTGLAMLTDYNDLRINYACGGNVTNEFMFNTTYLPQGASRTYTVHFIPVVGLDQVTYVGPEMVLGYQLKAGAAGAGRVELTAVRSAEPVAGAKLQVTVVGAMDTTKQVAAGTAELPALSDRPQTKALTYTGAPGDPLVLRIAATGKTLAGRDFAFTAEDFCPGSYKWADNIQTDMRSPVYLGPRPTQVLNLTRPGKLAVKPTYSGRYLFFQGLHDEDYQVAAALHTAGYDRQVEVIYYNYGSSWFGELSDFPYDYDKLLSYDAIILGGVAKSGLKTMGVEMLHDYLLAGGGLVVLGSHGAYARSQLKGTPFGEAWPVQMQDGVFDLQATRGTQTTGGTPVTFGPTTMGFLKYNALGPKATCLYRHAVTPKPGAQVVMQSGDQPFMVCGEYGPNRARIVCILGAPLGVAGSGQTPFWQDRGWYLILRNALWWAAKKDEHFD